MVQSPWSVKVKAAARSGLTTSAVSRVVKELYSPAAEKLKISAFMRLNGELILVVEQPTRRRRRGLASVSVATI